MKLEELVIPLKVDKSGFTGGLDSATKMLTNFAAVAAVAVAAAAVVVGKFIIDSTKLASDLAETVSKTGIVFGDSAKDIMDWAKTSAKSLGMSKNAALSAAATYGNLFRAMGITEKASAKMSMGLVNLAGDLASFNNMNPTEVLDKLRAGLSGETEPLRSLGVNLNQAMIEAKALEMGLWDGVDAIDASAKAQASYALIMEQTTLAQGDFSRTSEGLANQQRILAAQWEDLKTTLGSAFLPMFTKAITKFNEFVKILADPAGIDLSKIAAWADTTIAKFVKGLGDSINDWVSGGGPEAFSESLISWIEGIGDESRVKSKLEIAMGHLATAIGNALANIDWSGIWAATDTKLDEIFIAGDEKIKVAVNNIDTTFNDWMLSLTKRHHTWANNLVDIYSSWAARVNLVVNTWVAGVIATYNAWSTNINNTVNNALANLKISIQQKLDQIAQVFYQKAQSFINQAVQSFNASKQRLLDVVSALVGLINGILQKIMTTFTINVLMGSVLGGASGGAGGLGSSAPKNTTNTPHPGGGGRASGGPVIGGVSYNVAEFFRPERFTPNVSGRVDPMQPQTVTANIDESRLARVIVQALKQAQVG